MISPKTLEIIRQRVEKLLSLSSTLQDWEKSEYGNIIVIGNSDTLHDIRHCWEQYCLPDGITKHLNVTSELGMEAA